MRVAGKMREGELAGVREGGSGRGPFVMTWVFFLGAMLAIPVPLPPESAASSSEL